jgi:hypothetical protein
LEQYKVQANEERTVGIGEVGNTGRNFIVWAEFGF